MIAIEPESMPTTISEDAYEEFWHATEDDVCFADFDADEHPGEADEDDVYFAFVSSVEA